MQQKYRIKVKKAVDNCEYSFTIYPRLYPQVRWQDVASHGCSCQTAWAQGSGEPRLADYVARYASDPDVARAERIAWIEYDWSINHVSGTTD